MSHSKYLQVGINTICPSDTNPRKSFPKEYLAELAESIRQKGIVQPLLVRDLRDCDTMGTLQYELIAGECRLRAAGIAGLSEVPVLLRNDLSDEDVVEIQLIENLQRRDLDMLEEAESYARLMELEWDGKKRHSVESLASSLGKTVWYIHDRLRLLKLPESGRKAMQDGSLSFSVARLLGRVPGEKLRAKALEEVLHPRFSPEPLTAREAASHLRQHYMVDLKGVPFDKKSTALVPLETDDQGNRIRGGACTDCPFLSGNNPDFEDVGSTNVCTHPECYQAKMDAFWEEERMAALKEGKRVFSEAESEKVINRHGPGLTWDTPYVLLSDKVPAAELSAEVVKPPTWKKLIAGVEVKPEIVVVRDYRGAALEVVDVRQAVAAIRLDAKTKGVSCPLKGGKIFAKEGDASAAQQRAKERERSKVHLATVTAAMTALHDAISGLGMKEGYWQDLLEMAIGHAGADGLWLHSKWLGVTAEKSSVHSGRDFESSLRKIWEGQEEGQLLATIPILLISNQLKWMTSCGYSTLEFPEDFKRFAALYDVDLDALKKQVKADVTAEIKEAKKKKKGKKGKSPADAEGDDNE